jgi:hypothetical protein
MVRLFGRVQRIQNNEMRERKEYPNEEYGLQFESYQKVKETSFEVFGCSGGVARFSIAAFASKSSEAASRALDRGGLLETSPRAVDRGFKRGGKPLKVPPGAPSFESIFGKHASLQMWLWL